MKTNIKIIIVTIIVLLGIVLYNQHEDRQRAEYAESHNCTWVIQGAHDVCR